MLYQICRRCQRVFMHSFSTSDCRQCSPLWIPLDPEVFVTFLLNRLEMFDTIWRSTPYHSIEELGHLLSALLPLIDLVRTKGKLPRIRFIIENHLWRLDDHPHYYDLFQWFYSQFGNVMDLRKMFNEKKCLEWIVYFDFQEWTLFDLVHVCWSPTLFHFILKKLPSLLSEPSYFIFQECDRHLSFMDWLYLFYQQDKMTEDDYFIQLLRFNLLYIDLLELISMSVRKCLPPFLLSPNQEYNYSLFYFLLLHRPFSFLWKEWSLLDHFFYFSLHGKESNLFDLSFYPPLHSFKYIEFEHHITSQHILSYFEWIPNPVQFIIQESSHLLFLSHLVQRRNSSLLHFEIASYLLSQGHFEWAIRHFFRAGDYRLLCRYFSIQDCKLIHENLSCWNNTEDFVLFLLRQSSVSIH